jgi:hypothetical protein
MAIEVDNWDSATPDNITLVSGVDVDEGMLPSLINNAIRRIASAVAVFRKQAYCKDKNVTIQASGGALPATPAEGDLLIEY